MKLYTKIKANNNIILNIIEDLRITETQKSINKRIGNNKNFGIATANATKDYSCVVYWTLENNKELADRINGENFNLLNVIVNDNTN